MLCNIVYDTSWGNKGEQMYINLTAWKIVWPAADYAAYRLTMSPSYPSTLQSKEVCSANSRATQVTSMWYVASNSLQQCNLHFLPRERVYQSHRYMWGFADTGKQEVTRFSQSQSGIACVRYLWDTKYLWALPDRIRLCSVCCVQGSGWCVCSKGQRSNG